MNALMGNPIQGITMDQPSTPAVAVDALLRRSQLQELVDAASGTTPTGKIRWRPKKVRSAHPRSRISLKDISNYNNYYEFSTDKYEPAERAKNF